VAVGGSGLAADAQAQSGSIRGSVLATDSTTPGRRPVPGAQVTVVGTQLGALTNDAGEYTIRNVPPGTVTVRAQRIGFTPSDIRVAVNAGATATADFALVAVARTLSEVVVVGYGTSSRQNVSSAIASVTATEIANTPTAGVDAALQGKAPGVQVMQNAGNPGNGISVRVRGPLEGNATVTCVIPGHSREGRELHTDEIAVSEERLNFELTGSCGYESTFDYASADD